MPGEEPNVSLIDFKYKIEVSGGVLFIKDARTIEVVNHYHKIKPNLNIDEELVRIVFFAPMSPTLLDFKELKKGYLKFENFENKDNFLIKFVNKDGNNILNDIVTSFNGEVEFTVETIAEYFFR